MELTLPELAILSVLVNAVVNPNSNSDAALGYPTQQIIPRDIRQSLMDKNLLSDNSEPTELAIRLVSQRASGRLPSFDKIAKSLTPSASRMLILATYNSLAQRHENRKDKENPYYQNLMLKITDELINGDEPFTQYYQKLKLLKVNENN